MSVFQKVSLRHFFKLKIIWTKGATALYLPKIILPKILKNLNNVFSEVCIECLLRQKRYLEVDKIIAEEDILMRSTEKYHT